MQSKIKIAFFDIDGTLVQFWKKIPSEKTVYALNELKKKGILICIATGRTSLMLPKFEKIKFDVYITFNGSFCFNDKEIISKSPIPKKDVLQILNNSKRMNRGMTISNEKYQVTNCKDEILETYFSFVSVKNIVVDDFESRCNNDDIYQIMIGVNKSEYDDILKGTTDVEITAWWDKAVDIIPSFSGKGKAVNNILAYYGFSKDESIAFGDGNNDIEMLKAVGTGVAMENSNNDVKAAADVICKSVDDDGIYYYLVENGIIAKQ